MKRSLRTGGTLLSALGIIAVLLLCAGDTAEAAADALHLAATVLVPSLFPFAVLSGFLAARGTAAAWRRPLGRLTARLFHADPGCAAAWAMGWLCGFPIGAAVLAALTARGGIRRDSAARMLPVCSCAGPGFLVTVAGAQLLRSRRAGWLLLLVHLAASLLAGLTLRPVEPPPEAPDPPGDAPPSLPVAFTEAVRGAALAMVQLAGFLVFFSMLLALLRRAAGALGLGAGAVLLLSGLLELTNGLQLLTQTAAPLPLRFLLSAAMLGWSGLCVHAQVLSLALPAGLPARRAPPWPGSPLRCISRRILMPKYRRRSFSKRTRQRSLCPRRSWSRLRRWRCSSTRRRTRRSLSPMRRSPRAAQRPRLQI